MPLETETKTLRPRPEPKIRDQDRDQKPRDRDHQKLVSSRLETETGLETLTSLPSPATVVLALP